MFQEIREQKFIFNYFHKLYGETEKPVLRPRAKVAIGRLRNVKLAE